MDDNKAIEAIEVLLKDEVKVDVAYKDPVVAELLSQIKSPHLRRRLTREKGIAVGINEMTQVVTICKVGVCKGEKNPKKSAKKVPVKRDRSVHTYTPPEPAYSVLTSVLTDTSKPYISWLVGAAGGGKTSLAEYMSQILGRKLVKVDCNPYMTLSSIYGSKTVEVDPETKQNRVVWQDGPVIKSMQEGLDDDGNEVGEPAILFFDEAAAIPADVAIALNGLFAQRQHRREICISEDGNRKVVSHSGMRIVCAANTIGRGLLGLGQSEYHAQADGLDISTLDRIDVVVPIGYSKKAEKKLLMEKIGNDRIVAKMIQFRDGVRDSIKQGKTFTPFGTRKLVQVADMSNVLGDILKAIYYVVYTKLMPEEVVKYNEIAFAAFGKDIVKEVQDTDGDIDYM